ncbi:MAG: nascent polypeptide-associated complex protein [Candidatus Odinarchaeia archaeon]
MRRRMNPKLMKKAMKKMGIDFKQLEGVEEVIIRFVDKEIVISNPQVTLVKTGGQNSYQIIGQETERQIVESSVEESEESVEQVEIPIEDIKLVASQASVSLDEAEEALRAAGGNLAQAILNLKNR